MARETGNFDYVIDQSTPVGIVQIWDGNAALNGIISQIDPRDFYTVGCFLESIRLDIYLPSFDKAPFPEIYPEMSAAEKNVALMETEKKAPKTGIAFYRRKAGETSWRYLSEIILQNRGRRTQIPVVVPYLTTNQLKILGRGTQLGIEMINYGNGVIGNGPITNNRSLDRVQIEGDYRFDLDKSEFNRTRRVTVQQSVMAGEAPQIAIAANPLRVSWEIQNQGEFDVFFSLENSANAIQSGGFKIQPNQVAFSQPACEVESLWVRAAGGTSPVAVRENSY